MRRYHDFKNDTWDDFNRETRDKKIWIWGASTAKYIVSDLRKFDSLWSVEGIVDNDENKWGRNYITGWEVSPPSELMKKGPEEIVVLICGRHTSEISAQLSDMGIENYFSDIWMDNTLRDCYTDKPDIEKISMLKRLLSDQKSREVVDAIVNKRKKAEIDYSDICEFGNTEYFLDEFWLPGSNEVFIDGGGYTGDTIEEFIRWTRGQYKRIYSYEPQMDKYQLIKNKICLYTGNENIKLFDAGLWSEKTMLGFKAGNEIISGKISANLECSIKTVTIDETVDEPISFIKLDIEGAEIEAIRGGAKHIMADKPKLAIAIYHKLEDLWEIPLLIHELVPEYKFYIRHSGFRCYGTNLYAFI